MKSLELTFKLTQEEAQLILNAIAKEPLGQVIDVFNKIQLQASEQINTEELSK